MTGTRSRLAYEAARFIARQAWPNERTEGNEGWAPRLTNEPDMRAVTYRKAAKRLHPDAGGDPAAFARLQEAWEVLERHA